MLIVLSSCLLYPIKVTQSYIIYRDKIQPRPRAKSALGTRLEVIV